MQRIHLFPAALVAAAVFALPTKNGAAPQPEKLRISELPVNSARDTASAPEVSAPGRAAAKCAEAEVNPVTGHAECVRPRGAAVDPPPLSAVPCSAHYAAGDKRGCSKNQ